MTPHTSLPSLARLRTHRRTGRVSSWDKTGRNRDWWTIPPGQSRVLADLTGPGQITHIWFAQPTHFREVLLRITWDNAARPSVLCPVGDFFGLGNGFTTSYKSALLTASTPHLNQSAYDPVTRRPRHVGTSLNAYAPMPFRERAVIELVNESDEPHDKWFYIDYETFTDGWDDQLGYFHAEFRRSNPFNGWGRDLVINHPMVDVPNTERWAWDHNYIIAETKGRGQYIGCNLSVANICGGWWGEGDDMIWVDGYKWPPDLHGTGSEDYLGHAWGMQRNAYWRNGSSLYEPDTGGYQTSYVFHLENPVYFERELKVTIEAGHGNHLANDVSSVAYWYAAQPTGVLAPPPVAQRRPVFRQPDGTWILDPASECPGPEVKLTDAQLQATPAAAAGLDVRPWETWEIPRLAPRTTLATVARQLTATAPRPLGQQRGEVWLGWCGNKLAYHARLCETKLVRCEPEFWIGSAVELFIARNTQSAIEQLVFLPAASGRPAEVRSYRNQQLVARRRLAWKLKRTRAGYEVTALIPVEWLGLTPDTREFLFENIADFPTAPARVGLRSDELVYTSTRRFGAVTVANPKSNS